MTLGQRVAVINNGTLQQADTPKRLYDHPANLFVAGFLGSPPMNLFTASFGGTAGNPTLRWGETELDLPTAPPAGAVTAGLRPEAFHWPEDRTTTVRVTVTAEAVESLGHEQIVFFRLPTATQATTDESSATPSLLAARLPADIPVAPQTDVTLGVAITRLYWFDGKGNALGGGK
jgi:multiple sugar transport system ATP-binding protein